ncbi:YchF family ATPase [Candidatus Parcubacteria bacterium]|nr:MAG: YchF family ATPase [Candidatus Parcubacteria bacterium]
MQRSLGIVGLPNVGKSSLFSGLTKHRVDIAAYPFTTISPNVGVVAVPDERLAKVAACNPSAARQVPAAMMLYDIAGLVQGASRGEGLGNQFLAHIRETDAMIIVARAFRDSNVAPVAGKIDPCLDVEVIHEELRRKDLASVVKKEQALAAEARVGKKDAREHLAVIREVRTILEQGKFPDAFRNHPAVQKLFLLTAKPRLYLLNGREDEVSSAVRAFFAARNLPFLILDVATADDFTPLLRAAYQLLDLVSFFTLGDEETRAWSVPRGTTVREAAGHIHSDFAERFIRAEVIAWDELVAQGSWLEARRKGKIRIEKKEYLVRDGDVVFIRHQ